MNQKGGSEGLRKKITRRGFLQSSGLKMLGFYYTLTAWNTLMTVNANAAGSWRKIFDDNLRDGIPGPYPFETRNLREGQFAWSEENGILTAKGNTYVLDKAATGFIAGDKRLTVDFKMRDLLPGEWFGLQMGDILVDDQEATTDDNWVRLIYAYIPQGHLFRFLNKDASFDQRILIDPNTTQCFSLKLTKDMSNRVTAFYCLNFDPALKASERIYNQMPGFWTLKDKIRAGINFYYKGLSDSITEYDMTRFLVEGEVITSCSNDWLSCP